jgi:hypothetical protein
LLDLLDTVECTLTLTEMADAEKFVRRLAAA